MIQFNLLPDVKLEYVRVQRTKHTVISASLIAAGAAFFIFLLFFLTVHGLQKKNIGDLNKDITKYSNELKATPNLDKILTIQSQLSVLPSLHAEKPSATRTFGFLQQLTPARITLSDVSLDYIENTISITGQASGLDQVNTYIDTLKFTKFSNKEIKDEAAFSSVVLSEFNRTTGSSAAGATSETTFMITSAYNSAIFDNADTVTLTVPSTVSTRSVVQQPTDIFKAAPVNTNEKDN